MIVKIPKVTSVSWRVAIMALIENVQGMRRFGIFRKVGIEKKDGDLKTAHPLNLISPCPQNHFSPFDHHVNPGRKLLQEIFHPPLLWVFCLISIGIEFLGEVAFSVKQGDPDQRD